MASPKPCIVIADYDPAWPLMFASIRAQLLQAVGPLAVRIEHVGSTAVPGLAAKPVIDIDLVIATRCALPEVIERLATLGYQHEGDLGIAGRDAFRASQACHAHHLYVCTVDALPLIEHLAFRDALRADPHLAAAYGVLKRRLAAQHREDRAAYTTAKSGFVVEVLSRQRQ